MHGDKLIFLFSFFFPVQDRHLSGKDLSLILVIYFLLTLSHSIVPHHSQLFHVFDVLLFVCGLPNVHSVFVNVIHVALCTSHPLDLSSE